MLRDSFKSTSQPALSADYAASSCMTPLASVYRASMRFFNELLAQPHSWDPDSAIAGVRIN